MARALEKDQADAKERERLAAEELKANLRSRAWRMNNLYWIKDKDGNVIRFRLNPVQQELDEGLHTRNIVPKSRQHGITTWACIRALDTALFRKGSNCGIVAHNKADAGKFFRDKVLFAYDRLPAWLQAVIPVERRDMNGTLTLANGSQIDVSTSHRGGTLNFLHISEYGPICALQPQKAQEVQSGALNTVTADAIVVIESTAYGSTGDFFKKCQVAKVQHARVLAGVSKLTSLDYKLHFFPWWRDPRNSLNDDSVEFTAEDDDYFDQVEAETGADLSHGQRAWYVKKAAEQDEKMLREHPSTLDEAFHAAVEGAYYSKQLTKAHKEGRVCKLPVMPGVPINTFWDIGRNDTTAIWFHQRVGAWDHFVDYYETSGESVEHYARVLIERGYMYGDHYLPHDAEVVDWVTRDNKTRAQILGELLNGRGRKPTVVPRIENIGDGIDMTRQAFARCRFDAVKCGENQAGSGRGGLLSLQNYRKEWDDRQETWRDYPCHNWASNGADAFRQYAQSYRHRPNTDEQAALASRKPRRRRDSWKTA